MKILATVFVAAFLVAPKVFAAGGAVPEVFKPATQMDVVLLISYMLLALILSFVCSIAEAVLLSITPSYIANLQDSSPKTAKLLTQLKQENVDKSLAAILTLNTIAHTVGAIGSGAKATIVFGSAWFGLFSAVMTLLILFLSEIIPKTLGVVYWRILAAPTAQFVRMLILALYPLIYVSERLTRFIAGGQSVHAFNREEFVALASVGESGGQLEKSESRIIKNLFRFKSLTAVDIMTPRTVIHGMPAQTTVNEAVKRTREWPFSRIPIYQESLDQIDGYVLRDELLMAAVQDQGDQKLESLKRKTMTLLENTPLLDILEKLIDDREHFAIVISEYGGTEGLVTMEDVFETLLGTDIVDEIDRIDNMRAYARRQWARRAKALGIDVVEDYDKKDPSPDTS